MYRVVMSIIGSIGLLLVVIQVSMLLFFRMMEMLIYMAVSPIPMAMLASEGYKSTAKKFLMNFCATCLHATVILVMCYIWIAVFWASTPHVFNAMGTANGFWSTATIDEVIKPVIRMIAPFSLAMIVGKAGQIARSIVGV